MVSTTPPSPAPSPLRTLLIVDDDELNQRTLRHMAERLGYMVNTAQNGQQALEAAYEWVYTVVLMDVEMPVMDGLEATRRIRTLLPPTLQPPIIAVTAHNDLRDACLAAGMNAFVEKPLKLDDIEQTISHVLGQEPSREDGDRPAGAGAGIGSAR